MTQHFEVKPMTPTIGAEIIGLDLTQPMSDGTFEKLHTAFLDRKVLFFRDQDLTLDQHKDFGRRFGDLHVHPASIPFKQDGVEHPRRSQGAGRDHGQRNR